MLRIEDVQPSRIYYCQIHSIRREFNLIGKIHILEKLSVASVLRCIALAPNANLKESQSLLSCVAICNEYEILAISGPLNKTQRQYIIFTRYFKPMLC